MGFGGGGRKARPTTSTYLVRDASPQQEADSGEARNGGRLCRLGGDEERHVRQFWDDTVMLLLSGYELLGVSLPVFLLSDHLHECNKLRI
jgi:hypothetical protein